MLKIISGSSETAKKELKKVLASEKARATEIKKKYPAKDRDLSIGRQISTIEDFIQDFRVSAMSPVRVGDIVINYKAYEKLIKKLNGFDVNCVVENGSLLVSYSTRNVSGSMELFDLSCHLKSMESIPEAVIEVMKQ